MTKRCVALHLLTGLSAILAASRSHADPLAYRSFVGSMNNFNSFGELGFVHATVIDGNPSEGNFGAVFGSRVMVNSIVIDQRVDPGRHRMKDLRIYTSPYTYTAVHLADAQGPQTITLPGSGLTGDYFFMTVESLYDAGAVDNNPGLHALTFDGVVVAPRTNLNASLAPTAIGQFEPENYFLDVATNGLNVSTTGGPVDYIPFEYANTAERSITVNYASPQTVASVGLAFEGQVPFSYNSRPVPKFVTITDSNGATRQVDIESRTMQYGQYPLSSPLANTTSLTLTLPIGAENYYTPAPLDPLLPTSTLASVVEFEAFADAVVVPTENADFNGDNIVDGADFLIWQRGFGGAATALTGDANGDNLANALDLAIWKGQYGAAPIAVAAASVPEPASVALLVLPVTLLVTAATRRRL